MKKYLILASNILAFTLSAAPVFAQDTLVIPTPENLFTTDLGKLISGAIGFILILATLAAFIFLIIGGFQWITSGGDKGAVEAAQKRIQAAILGLFIVFAAWAIMIVVSRFFGIDFTALILPKGF